MILAKEQLQSVTFRRYADNKILDLSFQANAENPYEGAIIYQCEYDIEVVGEQIHCISIDGLDEDL